VKRLRPYRGGPGRAALLAFAASLPATLAAQPAARVADLTTVGATGSGPSGFARLGSLVLFAAADAANGRELWRTDGTDGGTWLVKDLHSGPDSSFPESFTAVGSRMFFTAEDRLWWTDGTGAGTVPVAAHLDGVYMLAELGGTLYFSAADEAGGQELWRTDGTEAGTRRVKDIAAGPNGSHPWPIVAFRGRVYFAATGPGGDELWTSDGTEAGTVPVSDIVPGPVGSRPAQLAVAGSTLFFTAYTDATGRELWKTDGTAAGTALVRDIRTGPAGQSEALVLAAVGSRLLFGPDDGVTGTEPWVSDGTAAGTHLLRDVRPGPASSALAEAARVGDVAYFVADDGTNGPEVWRTDGTPAGTMLLGPVSAFGSRPDGLVALGDALFFTADDGVHGREPWRADGTVLTLLDVNPTIGTTYDGLVSTGDALYFGGLTIGPSGVSTYGEPWRSDGTLAGTHLVKAISPAPSSIMRQGVAYAGAYYFVLQQEHTGFELWRSDGTAAGTALVVDLLPGALSGNPTDPVPWNGLLYFCGRDATGSALWRSDGTAAGTTPVKRFPEQGAMAMSLALVGNRLFLAAQTAAVGSELWTSDGTEAGTVLVRDVNPGPDASLVDDLTAFGSVALFTAYDGLEFELWRSDGTTAGTVRVAPDSAASSVRGIVVAGDRAFFTAADAHGRELWVTDGTAAGTTMLGDLLPGADGSFPGQMTALGSSLVFNARDLSAGRELWRSDGTVGGTVRLADVRPGEGSSNPSDLTASGGFVFFSADDGAAGREPWTTDGTAAGTVRLADAWPGAGSSMTAENAAGAWGGWAFFAAAAPGTGAELWRTDGTPAGTRLVQEIGPAESSAGIWRDGTGAFTAAAGRLFFRAVDGAGRELWALVPELAVSDATSAEGATATFTVTAVPRVEQALTVAFATADVTATAGVDFAPRSGVLTFTPGGSAHAVAVEVFDDGDVEGTERFALALSAPSVAYLRDATGVATIADDDATMLSTSDAEAVEGDGRATSAVFAVTRAGSSAAAATVAYATLSGTAAGGLDFATVSGTLTFAPGVVTRTVAVPVLGDRADEPDEHFLLALSDATGAAIADGLGRGLIRDDDGSSMGLQALVHGSDVRADLSGPSADDLYLLDRDPYASYEVLLDEASADAGSALDRVGADLSTVLQPSVPVGAGFARSLRVRNHTASPALDYVRVRGSGCGTGCGPDDVYRLRVRETTLRLPRFNATGGQLTIVLLQNRTDAPLTGGVTYWQADGTALATQAFALAPRAQLVLPTPPVADGTAGSITVAHDGPYASLAGKAIAVEPLTGLAFDTPLAARPR
jgi:ELWxxDGT repeat protein